MCRFGRDFSLGVGVCMTPDVTLVVHSVLPVFFSANAHLLIAHLPAPGNNHMVDVDGIVARPQDPPVNAKQAPFTHQDVDLGAWLPMGC
jgi:hypothetical protein